MQQMQLITLKEHGCLLVVEHLSVPEQGMVSESDELTLVAEENRRRSLLVVRIVTRVEHLDARLASGLK